MVGTLAVASGLLLTAQTSVLALTALEVQSYASYTIVAFGGHKAYRQSSSSTYLLAGALATAAFVLGWAMLTHIGELALARLPGAGYVGQALQVGGMLTKLGCFPLNFWLPTAYGGLE